jgi:anaerobic dimethyl sulfoxide reductase subunit C (anchor subunit)
VEGATTQSRNEWLTVLALIVVAIVAAFFHLGKPLGFLRMVFNLGSAWLSREILGFALFGLLAAVTFYMVYAKTPNGLLFKLTAIIGLLAVLTTGMAYSSAGIDAIHNLLPLVFFLLTVFTLGPACASYFAGEKSKNVLVAVLSPTLLASLVVRFAVPFAWLAGNTVTRISGQNFLASPLHWLHLVVLLAGFVAVQRSKTIPSWLPIALLIGELLGRIAFFALAVSSGANLGNLY